VKGQKIFTVSVASKPIPHPHSKFLLATSDPRSLASAKTGLTVMTATATLAEMNCCAATNPQRLALRGFHEWTDAETMLVFAKGRAS
jgi:hypothetical protein